MFLKEMHDRTIKAQGIADSRPQLTYTTKEVSSPTVSPEAMILSCSIYAKENR